MRRSLSWLVWNAGERRPRAPVRLLVGVAFIGVVGLAVTLGLQAVVAPIVATLAPVVGSATAERLRQPLLVVAGGVAVVVGVAVSGVVLDRRRLVDFGVRLDRDWWVDAAFGLALGAALMTGVFLVELAAGWVVVTGTFESAGGRFLPGFVAAVLVFLVVGINEELLLRGYLLTNVAEGLAGVGLSRRAATGVAVVLSSAVFGLLHLGNPNATAVSALGISLAGVMLALGYVLTADLAIPIGIHVTWNLFQGAVYGFPVSGLDVGVSVVGVRQRGPPALTGGGFGPEAGLLGIGAIILGAIAIATWVQYRHDSLSIPPELTTPDLRWR